MAMIMKAAKCPTDELSLKNRAIVSAGDFPSDIKYIDVSTAPGQHFIFYIERTAAGEINPGTIGFSLLQRKWATLSINQDISVKPYHFERSSEVLCSIALEVDFLQKKTVTHEPYDSDQMARDFLLQFAGLAVTVGQPLVFNFQDKKLLCLAVKTLEVIDAAAMASGVSTSSNGSGGGSVEPKRVNFGRLLANTVVTFEKAEGSGLNLVGRSKGRVTAVRQSIINPDWDFGRMGIGGLDREFNAIFRRAFASRVFPPEVVEQLGCKHVKGILLYGPPGTGKTLMARQIGTMLNAREPKIVNGPQILDKYVGESEANVRRLFADAEEEEKRLGPASGLHIIIFDEIDAICKARGTVGGNSGVHDTVVNQLLAKIDGVEQLNNILVIGMTNRRDMIDEALLRPGRLEVQMEISLPNEEGRVQILSIHTRRMKEFKKLAPDVDLRELGVKTKNFSGAELEGLVRAAQSTAMNRLIKAASKVEVDPAAMEKLMVTREDFLHAFENDIKPAFGTAAEALENYLTRGIINWGLPVAHILEDGALYTEQARGAEGSGLVSVLLEGPPNAGKTALAAKLAKLSDFPFVKVCSPDEMRLLDYGPIGPRYSNLTLQALLVLLKKPPPKGKKLLILCTTSRRQVLEDMEMLSAFTAVLHVPNLSTADHLIAVLEQEPDVFGRNELAAIYKRLKGRRIFVGIKKLLDLIDLARQMDPQTRMMKFLSKLEEEGAIEDATVAH
uniref:Vesicle-fusing ATPase n=1 Tax=Anopheles funestus TaxID=62324 RepID=A0A182RS91_ANOFN